MTDHNYKKSIDACARHYGDDAEAVKSYMHQGLKRALELTNRGPIRFNQDGSLHDDIISAYSENGFYIFQNVVNAQEMEDIKQDLALLRARFPTQPDAKLDASGRVAIGADSKAPGLLWSKPLSDPLGGTAIANGRHQVKLRELQADNDAPQQVPFVLLGSLRYSDAALRMYAHPELLKVAAAINGEDFAPFNETLFFKDPGLGAAVSWHQDGDTHWDSPEFDPDIHGFNFMMQVYSSTPVNGVWVLPGTHKLGKLDIKALVAESGSERLEGAVPIVCEAGDVAICNRQLVHGSFANAGFEPRLTINFGFHRRSAVLNVQGAGIHSESVIYDDQLIKKRTEILGYAIAARKQQYPDETQYSYKPFSESQQRYEWNQSAREAIRDYNLLDLSI